MTDPLKTPVWRAVHDKHTLDVCELADGAAWHGPVPKELHHHCRCWRSDIEETMGMPRHGLIALIIGQERMLAHASNTIARLEGRWRAPGAAKAGRYGLVVRQGDLTHHVALCMGAEGWGIDSGKVIQILAWCELPAIPSDDSYKDLI